MSQEKLRKDIENWIINFVSKHNKNLNSVPCPYAKQAWSENKVYVEKLCSFNELLEKCKAENLENLLSNKEVIVFGFDPNDIDLTNQELINLLDWFNKLLMQQDIVILEDDFRNPEEISGVNMNQGTWVLLLIQNLSKLNKASKMLEKQGYYKNWDDKNLEDIVKWRYK